MTIYDKIQYQLHRAIRRAWRKHRNVRDAAAAIGMPRSTFHEVAQRIGLDMSRPPNEAITAIEQSARGNHAAVERIERRIRLERGLGARR